MLFRSSPEDARWYAAFPQKADHLLYEILSYSLDAQFKIKKETSVLEVVLPDQGQNATEYAQKYRKSLGELWTFRVVYESLTYVTFFACHSKMTHSSTILRALQGDVMHFSWLSQSFPYIAIEFFQAKEPTMGVCLFMSLYSVAAALASKFTDINRQLCNMIEEFRKDQEKKQHVAEDNKTGQEDIFDQQSRRMNVHFVGEIPEDQESHPNADNGFAVGLKVGCE